MNSPTDLLRAYREHGRTFREMQFVYPVVSRRAGGVSIGLNLSPHKACNFDCLYCQVDRSTAAERQSVDMVQLEKELRMMLALVISGVLFEDEHFCDIPSHLRNLKDIAMSGDGEPTSESCFAAVCQLLANMRQKKEMPLEVKLVVITNATRFHNPEVAEGLSVLMAHGGEIWAKLDAGTKAYYEIVDRSSVSFERVMTNLKNVAERWPIVIQTLFCEIDGRCPSEHEITAYGERLKELISSGGQIKEVQLHTVARAPANHKVEALPSEILKAYAELLQQQLDLPFHVVGGLAG